MYNHDKSTITDAKIIYKNNVVGWYEKYRVKDEKEINRANDTWHNMLEEDIR